MNKALKALKTIKEIELSHIEYDEDEDMDGEWVYDTYEEYDGTIEENYSDEIKTIETSVKALEIIKKKKVDCAIILDFSDDALTFEEYNYYVTKIGGGSLPLTKKEFDFLKKVLK